jgi:tRNA(fMet)-specific endonuclease VapC
MNGKKCLLDTSIIIDFFLGSQLAKKQIENISELFISAITYGELLYGAENSGSRSKHLKQVNEFANICRIVQIDDETAKIYSQIKSQLKKDGKPIPENDIWIAASAMQNNLALNANDVHFTFIKELKLIH